MLWPFLLVILGCVYYCWSRRRLYKLAAQIKCDIIALPIIGHAHLAIGDGTAKMKALQWAGREILKQGGISRGWLGPRLFIVVADIDILEVVMKTCLEKDDLVSFIRLGIGNGSIFAPVSIWRPRRKIVAPTFSPKNLNKFVDIFSKQSSIMVSQLKKAPEGSFSIWNYFTTYTMDAVCETTLGYQPHSQHYPDQPFLKAFETISRLAIERAFSPWLHPDIIYKMTSQYTSFMNCKTVLTNFIAQIIRTYKQKLTEKDDDISKGDNDTKLKTILELLIDAGGDNGFNDLELLEEALVMVLADTDTSAVGAAFTVLMLARHQDVQQKVHQEIINVLGDKGRVIVAEDLPHLKYLDAVIRESLRLHPPVPITVRKIHKDVTLPSGLTLLEGCGMVIHNWAVNRNPKYWGPDAEEFRPERFLEHYNTRAFMAFSSGPRNCLGYQYAMMSMKTMLASFIRQYQVLPALEDIILDGQDTKCRPIEETFEIMMKDANKFRVRIKSRHEH